MTVVVKDLLSSAPVCLTSDATVEEALRLVLEREVTEIYVIDEAGRLEGVVTDYELLKSQLTDTVDDRNIDSLMCCSLPVVSANDAVTAVAARFREARHAQMAVVENGRLIGVIGRRDIMRSLTACEAPVAFSKAMERTETSAETPRSPRYLQPASTALGRIAVASL